MPRSVDFLLLALFISTAKQYGIMDFNDGINDLYFGRVAATTAAAGAAVSMGDVMALPPATPPQDGENMGTGVNKGDGPAEPLEAGEDMICVGGALDRGVSRCAH